MTALNADIMTGVAVSLPENVDSALLLTLTSIFLGVGVV